MANTNKPFKNSQGQNTYQGSKNQGTSEANRYGKMSPQQAGESASSFSTRKTAFGNAMSKKK